MMKRNPGIQSRHKEDEAVSLVKQWSHPLHGPGALKPLFDRIGDSRIVMLGEASHGTHEFYIWRAYITKKLIEEKGFHFIAVEGDWPDCYQLNRYIKGYVMKEEKGVDVLKVFNRWPTWMWANWEVVALADWLHQFNQALPKKKKIGFYGLDVYSLWESMESVMHYLQGRDPAALQAAEDAYRCFEPYRKDEGRSYGRASMFVPEICQQEVVELLRELRLKLPQYNTDHENVFSTEQNALVAVNAEKYYRAMVQGGPHSWNVRDRHMSDTLDRLLDFHGPDSKAIIWAHNTHIGDARATDMAVEGMFNIGELARMQHNEKGVVLVGFGTYAGSVIAGRSWGAKLKSMDVPPARPGSWEYILREASPENKLVIMEDMAHNDVMMENHFGHRAIGVVYDPAYEQYGNYVPTILPLRYDAFIYLDLTKALHPLRVETDKLQIPDTFPFGV